MRRLGVADSDIDAIEQSGESRRRLPLRAPVDGVIAELGAREGGSVAAGETVLEITPRSQVWIEALLFPAQRMQLGDTVEGRFTLPGLAGTEWRAEASYIAPSVDPVTQTLAVRFPIPEAGDALPLGAWLDAEIAGTRREDVLVVPSSAVIRTRQGNRVVRLAGEDRFEPVAVELGAIHEGWTEIVSGLSEGDGIVLSGQFLLDSEAELTSGLQRMQGHDHGGGH
ncbi:efflux RND transporter periplasmic adaptor subunit [Alkalisalibacterium limincola]|uniref:efflux RND transporter periplasmic adaptor subunit n=1 Tax=Alkalisalibacterium limincola TaxID=2699169 RepID=UPI002102B2C0|nr:efflux RND transporter periplasmic adaptor subunit [Alkalisalibacterium limincola]